MENATRDSSPDFGPVHIVHPSDPHTHTIIFLHGTGSNGEEFAEELFESTLSDGTTLQNSLPGWRWVFPSSKPLWSTTFQEDIPAWFEARSHTDPTTRQDLQIPGIEDSVKYLTDLLGDEISGVDGRAGRVVLGGISGGGAIAIWTLLCQKYGRLGGFVCLSAWCPFAANIQRFMNQGPGKSEPPEYDTFVSKMMTPLKEDDSLLLTPVFVGHGTDDAYVDINLGREIRAVFEGVSCEVEWREYEGAELEGHWLKAPEEFDDLVAFLRRVSGRIS